MIDKEEQDLWLFNPTNWFEESIIFQSNQLLLDFGFTSFKVDVMDQVSDPVDLLLSVRWDGVPFMVEAFALLAVGTSLIGTLLSFSEFFKEQLNNLALDFPPTLVKKSSSFFCINGWWEKNKTSITATAMVVAPSLVVSNSLPDAFPAATDFAGGYCMAILYRVLPPAMVGAMKKKKQGLENEQTALSTSYPAIFGVGLFSCGIVLQQILHDCCS